MKNDASDAKIPVGLLLPVWFPPSWKMAAKGLLTPIFHEEVSSTSKFTTQSNQPSHRVLPIYMHYLQYTKYPYGLWAQFGRIKSSKTPEWISETLPPTLISKKVYCFAMTLLKRVCFIFRSRGSVFPQMAKMSTVSAQKGQILGVLWGLCPHPSWY